MFFQPKSAFGILGFHHYQINCVIGIHPEERQYEQIVFVDLKIKVDLTRCLASGEIQDTIDYGLLAQLCSQLAKQNHYHLLETFASDILKHCLQRFHAVWAWVSIQKPAAIPSAAYAYVELERYREEDEKSCGHL